MADEYPRDEFDQIAESAGPVGVHRAPRPWWILVVTPVVVFIVAGLLAFLIAQLLWNSGDSSGSTPTPSVTASATVSPSPSVSPSASAEPTESATPEPTETAEPEPEPVVDFGASVAVLNGTGITGLAGGQQTVLEDAGFTDVSAANLSGDRPDVNTVVYADDAMADTAQAVADALGFDAVVQGTPTGDTDVEVQIVTDPR